MMKISNSKSLLLAIFLVALSSTVLYLSRSATTVYSGTGSSSCGNCGSSTCRPGGGCSGKNPYRFSGVYWGSPTYTCNDSSLHCHRCSYECGTRYSPFSYCVQSCGGGGGGGGGG